jgi:subtilisin family serine protease
MNSLRLFFLGKKFNNKSLPAYGFAIFIAAFVIALGAITFSCFMSEQSQLENAWNKTVADTIDDSGNFVSPISLTKTPNIDNIDSSNYVNDEEVSVFVQIAGYGAEVPARIVSKIPEGVVGVVTSSGRKAAEERANQIDAQADEIFNTIKSIDEGAQKASTVEYGVPGVNIKAKASAFDAVLGGENLNVTSLHINKQNSLYLPTDESNPSPQAQSASGADEEPEDVTNEGTQKTTEEGTHASENNSEDGDTQDNSGDNTQDEEHSLFPQNATSDALTGAVRAWQHGITGKGVNVAVIDTGLDYVHTDFGGSGDPRCYSESIALNNITDEEEFINAMRDFEGANSLVCLDESKVLGGYDFATGDANYLSFKRNPDTGVILNAEEGTHGTHVAGTIAGYGTNFSDKSTYVSPNHYAELNDAEVDPGQAAGKQKFLIGPGSSPEAGLYFLKAFPDYGWGETASDDAIGDSLDWILKHNITADADHLISVVNLSLGSDNTPADEFLSTRVDLMAAQGVLPIIAAGNAGDTQDVGGSPGNAKSVLTVAASNNGVATYDSYFEVNDAEDPIEQAEADSLFGTFSTAYVPTSTDDITAHIIVINAPDNQGAQELENACSTWNSFGTFATNKLGVSSLDDFDDEFVMVRYGTSADDTYVAQPGHDYAAHPCSPEVIAHSITEQTKAKGVILWRDDTAEDILQIGGTSTFPMLVINKTQRDIILSHLAQNPDLTVTFPYNARRIVHFSTDQSWQDTPATFTARSAHGQTDHIIKPDVSAPGVNLFSANSGTGDSSLMDSGTSMATPHVAGLAALTQQAHLNTNGWSVADTKNDLINSSYSQIKSDYDPNVFNSINDRTVYDINRVGVGRPDAGFSSENDVTVFDKADPALVTLSFGVIEVKDDIYDATKTAVVKNWSNVPRTYAVKYEPIREQDGVEYTTSVNEITVQPHSTAEFNVSLHITREDLRHNIESTRNIPDKTILNYLYLTQPSGRISLTDSGDTNRPLVIGVHSAPKPVSTTSVAPVTINDNSASTFKLQNTGQDTFVGGANSDNVEDISYYHSLMSPFELVEHNDVLPTDAAQRLGIGNDTIKSLDIKNFGVSTNSPLLNGEDGQPDKSQGVVSFAFEDYGNSTSHFQGYNHGIKIKAKGKTYYAIETHVLYFSSFEELTQTSRFPQYYDVGTAVLFDEKGQLVFNNQSNFDVANGTNGTIDYNAYETSVHFLPVTLSNLGFTKDDEYANIEYQGFTCQTSADEDVLNAIPEMCLSDERFDIDKTDVHFIDAFHPNFLFRGDVATNTFSLTDNALFYKSGVVANEYTNMLFVDQDGSVINADRKPGIGNKELFVLHLSGAIGSQVDIIPVAKEDSIEPEDEILQADYPEYKDMITIPDGSNLEVGTYNRINIENVTDDYKLYAGAVVRPYIYSDATSLGQVVVQSDNAGLFISLFIPADFSIDEHVLAVYDALGNIAGWTGVSVVPSSTKPGDIILPDLANTGVSVALILLLLLILGSIGVLLLKKRPTLVKKITGASLSIALVVTLSVISPSSLQSANAMPANVLDDITTGIEYSDYASTVEVFGHKWDLIGLNVDGNAKGIAADQTNTATLFLDMDSFTRSHNVRAFDANCTSYTDSSGITHYDHCNGNYGDDDNTIRPWMEDEFSSYQSSDSTNAGYIVGRTLEGAGAGNLNQDDGNPVGDYIPGLIGGADVTDAKLWPLSDTESLELSHQVSPFQLSYWLRTPGNKTDLGKIMVSSGLGNIIGPNLANTDDWAVRPTFTISLDAPALSDIKNNPESAVVGTKDEQDAPTPTDHPEWLTKVGFGGRKYNIIGYNANGTRSGVSSDESGTATLLLDPDDYTSDDIGQMYTDCNVEDEQNSLFDCYNDPESPYYIGAGAPSFDQAARINCWKPDLIPNKFGYIPDCLVPYENAYAATAHKAIDYDVSALRKRFAAQYDALSATDKSYVVGRDLDGGSSFSDAAGYNSDASSGSSMADEKFWALSAREVSLLKGGVFDKSIEQGVQHYNANPSFTRTPGASCDRILVYIDCLVANASYSKVSVNGSDFVTSKNTYSQPAMFVKLEGIDFSPITTIELTGQKSTLKYGETMNLSKLIQPDAAINNRLYWTSSNSAIVSVDSNGNVVANDPGTATITADAIDGSGLSASFEILVVDRAHSNATAKIDDILGDVTPFKNDIYWATKFGFIAPDSPDSEGALHFRTDEELSNSDAIGGLIGGLGVSGFWDFTDYSGLPTDSITRVDLASALYSIAGKPSYTIAGDPDASLLDISHLTDDQKSAIVWAVATGIIPARTYATFDPDANVTRAEYALHVHKLYKTQFALANLVN